MEREARRFRRRRTATTAARRRSAASPALRIDGAAPDGPTILWLHGGAYCLGSGRTHARDGRGAGAAGRRARRRCRTTGWRPSTAFPAAVEDARAAWDGAARGGRRAGARSCSAATAPAAGSPSRCCTRCWPRARPAPAAVVAFSPWADLTGTGASLRTLARRDALIPVRRFAEIRDLYLDGADPRDPRASPVFGRFAGAPPTLIQSSRAEALRDDARLMAARLREDGATVEHDEQRAGAACLAALPGPRARGGRRAGPGGGVHPQRINVIR